MNQSDRTKDDVACFAPPTKRSVTIAGHQTAISLEPLFWRALRRAAEEENLPLNALIAQIDLARLEAAQPPNLASAVRCWVLKRHLVSGNNYSQ